MRVDRSRRPASIGAHPGIARCCAFQGPGGKVYMYPPCLTPCLLFSPAWRSAPGKRNVTEAGKALQIKPLRRLACPSWHGYLAKGATVAVTCFSAVTPFRAATFDRLC